MVLPYILAAAIALAMALVLTPLVIHLSHLLRLFDLRDMRKVHTTPTPRTGGVAVYISVICVCVAALSLDRFFANAIPRDQLPDMLVILGAGTFMFLVGLLDDLVNLGAKWKLLAQVAAATAVRAAGIRISLIPQLNYFELGGLDWPVTILWIVIITNAVNLIDGLDGLAAGISLMTCGVIAVFSIHAGQSAMAILMLAMVGSLLGFLVFNFSPAKIFLGDSGSLFLGFMLASMSLLSATKVATIIGILLPLLFLGLPIFDLAISIVRRMLARRSPFSADREHIHHRLLDLGITHRRVVIMLYGTTLLVAGLGAAIMLWRKEGELTVLIVIIAMLGIFRLAGVLRFRQMWQQVTQNVARMRQNQKVRRDYERLRSRFRSAWRFDQWWRAVRRLARRLDFVEIVILYIPDDGSEPVRCVYRRPGLENEPSVHLQFPCPSGLGNHSVSLEILALKPDSLEIFARRLALMGRLLEEHPVQDMPAAPPTDNVSPESHTPESKAS